MERSSRRRLFYLLVLLFIVLATLVIGYAHGWRLDLETRSVEKVGGVYVRSFPENAEIYLNGKRIERSLRIFRQGTFVGNLFPKTYNLTLKSGGFRDLATSVVVQPSLVSELKYAVLIPTETSSSLKSSVENFWISGDKIIAREPDGSLVYENMRIAKSVLLAHTKNFYHFVAYDSKNIRYLLVDAIKATTTNLNPLLTSLGGTRTFSDITFVADETDPTSIAIAFSKSLYTLDLRTLRPKLIWSSRDREIDTLAFSRLRLSWASTDTNNNSSTIQTYDRVSQTTNEMPIPLGERVRKMSWYDGNTLGIVNDKGDLSIYDTDSGNIKPLASDVLDFVLSDDRSHIATLESQSIEIFSLDDEKEYWRFNMSDADKIKEVTWYKDNRHLFIHYPDRISFLDLNDSSKNHFETIRETREAKYEPSINRLYFLDGGRLFHLDFSN